MAEIEVVTEVSGRVCALAVETGRPVEEGADVVIVEAMKMEIPATAPGSGTVKAILVNLDDLVAEGEVVAIIES